MRWRHRRHRRRLLGESTRSSQHALDVLPDGGYRASPNLDMSNDVAEEEGMVCGGRLRSGLNHF
jgi:hypothetical protein